VLAFHLILLKLLVDGRVPFKKNEDDATFYIGGKS
jgi:hypothetical protein